MIDWKNKEAWELIGETDIFNKKHLVDGELSVDGGFLAAYENKRNETVVVVMFNPKATKMLSQSFTNRDRAKSFFNITPFNWFK